MLIDTYTPPPIQVWVAARGAADSGEDYIFPLNQYGYHTREQADKAIAADKAYFAKTNRGSFGGLLPGATGARVYKIIEAKGFEVLGQEAF